MIKYHHLKKGIVFGISVGVAIAASSVHYTGSIFRGVSTGLLVALLGAVLQGWFEARAEVKRKSLGILLQDPPLRPKAVLVLRSGPAELKKICLSALENSGVMIKKVEVDDSHRLVALTKPSFASWSERIEIKLEDDAFGYCELAISSVPRLDTTMVDMGKNYMNVHLLTEFIKKTLGGDAIVKEAILDLENASGT